MYTFSNEKVKRLNDKLSREERSRVMSHIRVQSKLENKFSHALWQKGIRFRKNDRKLFGTPDISIKKIPKSNTKFWENKLNRNVERDEEVTNHYIEEGWNIYRIWAHELKSDFESCVQSILDFVDSKK